MAGRIVACADILFGGPGIVFEIDGATYHDDAVVEKLRDGLIEQAHLRVHHIPAADVFRHPRRVLATIRAEIGAGTRFSGSVA